MKQMILLVIADDILQWTHHALYVYIYIYIYIAAYMTITDSITIFTLPNISSLPGLYDIFTRKE